ncbi:MAG: hypothetical protein IJE00_01255 [Clostridia bacterium]|nr:hypothetical protein [Clostridia bacterium]
MFYRPLIQPIAKSTVAIDAFGGYDHNLRIADGSLYDMKNLTSDNYPVLTPRKRRGRYTGTDDFIANEGVEGAISNNGMCIVADAMAFIDLEDGEHIQEEDLDLEEGQKTLVKNGSYVVIFPDKRYFSTPQTHSFGSMETSFEHWQGYQDGCKLFFRVYDEKMHECVDLSVSGIIDDPADGCIAFDAYGGNREVKQWNEKAQKWQTVTKLYLGLYAPYTDIDSKLQSFKNALEIGDVLVVRKFDYYQPNNEGYTSYSVFNQNTYLTVEEVSVGNGAVRTFSINDTESIYRLISRWGYFKVGLDDTQDDARHKAYITEFSIEKAMPEMDFVIECNNRLWGCRYGDNRYGEFVNEIYAAKQGDFTNWNTFAGISTDSYVASCGASGPFTGAVNFNGRPLFFKEDHYYLVSGDYPAEYGYTDGPIDGVQKGSGKSLVVIDRIAYYKGVNGVYAFDGYNATCISAALGEVAYKNARAGAYRDKYYISMQDANDAWHLFVYDTKKGLWHKEDDLRVDYFFNHNSNLFYLVDGMIYCIDAETQSVYGVPEEEIEPPVEWMAETGNLTTGIPYKKYLSKLNVRMKVHKGASVRIFIQYDESGKWEELFYMTATAQRSFTIPIRPKRCDHIKLKLTGVGDVEVYSIIKTLEKGSDL